MAAAIPFTLNQTFNFEYNHKEMMIHSERGHPIYTLKGKESLYGEIFHTIEFVESINKRSQKKSLNVTVQYEDKVISRVLIDLVSRLKIYPLGTLIGLEVDLTKMKTWRINVRAFDSS